MVLRILLHTSMPLFSNLINSIIMTTLEPKMKFSNRGGGGACWALAGDLAVDGKLCFESCVKT